jgi:tRNA threonylcarbamoyladenosine biosynthesis protein TsaB
MKLLAIETATEACSAALLAGDGLVFRYRVEPRRHSELILPMMDELLAEAGLGMADLDAMAFGRGPGSFTGVRIAAGVVQGAAFACDLPVVPVSTLAALAQGGFRQQGQRRLLPAYDARMGEIYWGAYQVNADGLVEPVIEDQVAAPELVADPGGEEWYGVGSGWQTYGEALAGRLGGRVAGIAPESNCHARDVALLAAAAFQRGEAVPAEEALPVYLRDKVASRPAAR